MGDTTEIAWCDATFNPWIGCTKISSGCQNCYAAADMDQRRGRVKWGPNGTRSKTSADYWRKPLKWNRDAEKSGQRIKVFCASLADVFEDWGGPIVDAKEKVIWRIPSDFDNAKVHPLTMDHLRSDLFALIDQTPWLDWMLLTKRPENIRPMWVPGVDEGGFPQLQPLRHNVHLYYSASDQPSLESGIGELLACRDLTPTLGLSLEPLVGEIVLDAVVIRNTRGGVFETSPLRCDSCGYTPRDIAEQMDHHLCKGSGQRLDHVIIGGESGPNARPCNVAWIRSLVRQCRVAGTACFVKQLGAKPYQCIGSHDSSAASYGAPVDCRGNAGFGCEPIKTRDPKGGDPMEWHEEFRVRQFPKSFEGTAK